MVSVVVAGSQDSGEVIIVLAVNLFEVAVVVVMLLDIAFSVMAITILLSVVGIFMVVLLPIITVSEDD